MSIRPGEVEIKLAYNDKDGNPCEETIILRPTLNVSIQLFRRYDNYQRLSAAIASLDFNAFVAVAVIGSGSEGKSAKDLERKVFETGMFSLVSPFIKFVMILANGGKPLDDDDSGSASASEVSDPNGG